MGHGPFLSSQACKQRFTPQSEHEPIPGVDEVQKWLCRQYPFSNLRSSFEVHTYRLCRRILVFQQFPEELDVNPCLVRSTDSSYQENPIASFRPKTTVRSALPAAYAPRKDARPGLPTEKEATLAALTEETVKSSAIEGEELNPESVRSSLARHMGLEAGGTRAADRNVEAYALIREPLK